ncbi:TIGR04219 family outer membrane beta-barrel protein [Vibrio sp. D431a]|uniref:TIGR04219 family outer membrane beta-barrel protein n=1 Tax=Vibrio sp. D431a TaxID=2837388 RepID=UPI002552597D|nr:TIGR04219 family outer membrane beta-barrel protein [Vibrio sp. D431a]MDK9790134.1 TIGR04219 family outer membrane beta-barrel protein [Vibrio sp. D431a]
MKIQNLAVAAILVASPLSVSASTLGFAAGAELTYFDASHELNNHNIDGEPSKGVSVYFEHPLPLIPNLRFENNSFEAKDSFKFSQSSLTAYYNVLDTDLVELDAGLGYSNLGRNNWKGKQDALNNDTINYYTKGEVHLPFTGLSAFGSALGNYGRDYTSIDVKLGAKYTLDTPMVKPSLSVGYRVTEHNFDDLSRKTEVLSNDGFFAAVAIELK